MDNQFLIEKLQSTLGAEEKLIKKIVVFAENKQAAKEHVFNLNPFSENFGTFRIVNKGEKVCYDIIGMNENTNSVYNDSAYFDGNGLVFLKDLLSKAMPVYEEDFTDTVEKAVEEKISAKKGRRKNAASE